jgi:PBP1b-binding outer membrane lipoprotein LpoB
MKKLLLVALTLAGCAAPEDPDPVASTRQAGSTMVVLDAPSRPKI